MSEINLDDDYYYYYYYLFITFTIAISFTISIISTLSPTDMVTTSITILVFPPSHYLSILDIQIRYLAQDHYSSIHRKFSLERKLKTVRSSEATCRAAVTSRVRFCAWEISSCVSSGSAAPADCSLPITFCSCIIVESIICTHTH